METVEIIRDSRSIEKPKLLSENRTEIFAPKKIFFKNADYTEFDTGIVIVLPKKLKDTIGL